MTIQEMAEASEFARLKIIELTACESCYQTLVDGDHDFECCVDAGTRHLLAQLVEVVAELLAPPSVEELQTLCTTLDTARVAAAKDIGQTTRQRPDQN